jgi:hypothetical protein
MSTKCIFHTYRNMLENLVHLKLVLQTTLTCVGKNVPSSEGTFAKFTLLNATGNFTYHKVFDIQKFYLVITWNLRVLYGSRNKHRILPFIHSVICLTTGPSLLPKRFLHILRSRASSFK